MAQKELFAFASSERTKCEVPYKLLATAGLISGSKAVQGRGVFDSYKSKYQMAMRSTMRDKGGKELLGQNHEDMFY